MKCIYFIGVIILMIVVARLATVSTGPIFAKSARNACPRPEAGALAKSPPLVRSRNSLLDATLTLRNAGDDRFCLLYNGTVQSPTLWVEPGDTIVLRIRNELNSAAVSTGEHQHPAGHLRNPCFGAEAASSPLRTNLHFHGLNIPPTCRADDVLGTVIPPGATFVYRFKIPINEPPGLYWYHPHPHGLSEQQVLGGATGALVVRGIEQVNPIVRGLPEQILILRDVKLPAGVQSSSVRLCADQEGSTQPAKDATLNFVPIPFAKNRPARIYLGSGERQFWRVLNASADTYFDLQLSYDGHPQAIGVVAVDGVPTRQDDVSRAYPVTLHATQVLLPPGARVEFIVQGPASWVREARLMTLAYDTGPDGDCDPERVLARIDTERQVLPVMPIAGAGERPLRSMRFSRISVVKPVRTRKLYFSENNDRGEFYITEDRSGNRPRVFNPFFTQPAITVQQGTVEDWVIENRSRESHTFHIHQIHFQVLEHNRKPANSAVLRDTIDVPFWNGKENIYPSVKLRMDFRDPEIAGTFVYHCHILEHEDGGMMGTIEVKTVGKTSRPL